MPSAAVSPLWAIRPAASVVSGVTTLETSGATCGSLAARLVATFTHCSPVGFITRYPSALERKL